MPDTLETYQARYQLNKNAFDAIRRNAKIGMTELEVRDIILDAWKATSGTNITFAGDVISGARTGGIEGEPTDKVICRGDNMLVDVQPLYAGKYADTARTFYFGTPSEKAQKAHALIVYTIGELQKMLRPGVPVRELYRTMQAIFGEHGLSCPHHAGHMVDKVAVTEPRLIEECDATVEEGAVVALEPGIYYEGEFGIRLENNFLVTHDGCVNLFEYPIEMEQLIIEN